MKILQISDTIKNIGGAEKVLYDIKKLLEKNNHDISLWGTNAKKIKQSIFSIFNLKYYLKLKKYLKNNTFDIIHIHKFNSILSSSIFLAIPKKTKTILHIHDFNFYCYKLGITKNNKECNGGIFHKNCKQYNYRKLEFIFNFIKWLKFLINRFFIKKYVDVFICPSKKLQKYMIKSLSLPKEKVIYLPNFIKSKKDYNPNFEDINDKKFLLIGRLSKEKGVNIAIKAFDILINKQGLKDIIFEIIGNGPEKENLQNLVKKLNLEKNIKFLGKINNDKLGKYYNSSIAVLMPSIWLENNPIVGLEAMKYGKPIIATDVGGYPDLIENNKNGYLFSIGNYIELAEKIKNFYKNKKLSINMGTYGFKKLKKDFGTNKFYNKLIEIYEKK